MKQTYSINLLFDMETGDPDDVMTLCFLTSHPAVALRAVTVTPGTDEQIGVVREVLRRCGQEDIPVGSFRPGYEKSCVSGFHYKWLGKCEPAKPDAEGHTIIAETVKRYPDLTILTGGPLKNFTQLDPELRIARWVAQGGFAGDNIVPVAYRLPKFAGKYTCPTYNFNGAPKQAEAMLANPLIAERRLISKNVCHGMVYDQDFHDRVLPFRNASAGLQVICEGMDKYLQKRSAGKKFHDPLAACAAIDPDIITYCEVEMYRKHGGWGAVRKEGSNTFISIAADRDRFIQTFTTT